MLQAFFLSAALVCAEIGLPAPAVLADAAEIERLIEQLGSNRFPVRQAASKRLEAIGEPALASLQQATATSHDPEVRQRAALVIRAIEQRLFRQIRRFGMTNGYWINRLCFTPNGRQALATGGAVILYDLETGKELRRVLELSYARLGLALSRDGRYFLTGHDNDTVVRLGEVESGKEVQTFVGHSAGVQAVAFSPDETRAVSGGKDETLRLWSVPSGKQLRQFTSGTGGIRAVAFSPDGRFILSGHYGPRGDNLIRLWDVERGKEVRRFAGHGQDVTSLLFLPAGRLLLSSSLDGTLRLWELASGKELRRMTHPGGVYSAALSPDGRRALSAGNGDRTLRLWDLSNGRELHGFGGHQDGVLGAAFSPDGRYALSSDASGAIYLWSLREPAKK